MASAVNWAEFRRSPTLVAVGAAAIAATVAWGAAVNVSPLFDGPGIRRGELWRLLTSALLHGSALHLAFNLYWLWQFGRPVETVFGHLGTALLLAFLAAGSSAFEFAFLSGGVGLSGVVYGLFGLLWVLSRRDNRFPGVINRSIILLFIAWFFLCIVATVTNLYPIGNVAHGSGFVFGVLVGFALTASPPQRRWLGIGIGALFLFGLWGATLGRPLVNLSGAVGDDDAAWGYEALVAHHDQEALRWLLEATRLKPKVAEHWYNLGIAYGRLGDDPASRAAFDRARALKPNLFPTSPANTN